VCGHLVFYYQNEFGSRVFFDDLAPDWPKHPCTDSDSDVQQDGVAPIYWSTVPEARPLEEIEQIHQGRGDWIPEGADETKVSSHFATMRLLRRLRVSGGVALILEWVEPSNARFRFVVCDRLPKNVVAGALVWLKGRCLSYFDPGQMEGSEVEVRFLRGASRLVHELIA